MAEDFGWERPAREYVAMYERARELRSSRVESGAGAGDFQFFRQGDEVVITHRGRRATTLRGDAAGRFLEEVALTDPQRLMARLTGNYKRVNESLARNHRRNR